jgi:hypothetical protein
MTKTTGLWREFVCPKKYCRAGEKLRWALDFSSGPAVAENTTPGGERSVAGTIIKERKEVLHAFTSALHQVFPAVPPLGRPGWRPLNSRVSYSLLSGSQLPTAGPTTFLHHPRWPLLWKGGHTPWRACAYATAIKTREEGGLYFAVFGGRVIPKNRQSTTICLNSIQMACQLGD